MSKAHTFSGDLSIYEAGSGRGRRPFDPVMTRPHRQASGTTLPKAVRAQSLAFSQVNAPVLPERCVGRPVGRGVERHCPLSSRTASSNNATWNSGGAPSTSSARYLNRCSV